MREKSPLQGEEESKRPTTKEQWIERQLAKAPPISPERQRKITAILSRAREARLERESTENYGAGSTDE